MSNTKFRIYKKSREQGNLTGHPWLINFPPGFKFLSNGWTTLTSDGTCFDTFEEACRYMARRLNEEAGYHRRRVAAAYRLIAAEAAA